MLESQLAGYQYWGSWAKKNANNNSMIERNTLTVANRKETLLSSMKPSGTWRHNVNVLSSNKLPFPFSTTSVLGKLWGDTEHFSVFCGRGPKSWCYYGSGLSRRWLSGTLVECCLIDYLEGFCAFYHLKSSCSCFIIKNASLGCIVFHCPTSAHAKVCCSWACSGIVDAA